MNSSFTPRRCAHSSRRPAREPRSVVEPNRRRIVPLPGQPVQHPAHTRSGQRDIHLDGERFPGIVIHHREEPGDLPPRVVPRTKLVRQQVPAPATRAA